MSLSLEAGMVRMKHRLSSMLQNLLVVLSNSLPDRSYDAGMEAWGCETGEKGLVESEAWYIFHMPTSASTARPRRLSTGGPRTDSGKSSQAGLYAMHNQS